MCGITGIFDTTSTQKIDRELIQAMTESIRHRGPDSDGIHIDNNVALGFRRLSIIDLSAAGNQPMCSSDKHIWLVFNGEIYNYLKIKTELIKKGYQFRSQTDSEVIIYAYKEYGVDCLQYLDGMFAFALWDNKKRELFVARDRFGIKPLVFYFQNGLFIFGSELKTIKSCPLANLSLNQQAVWDFTSLMQIPGPSTIYNEVNKLLPGHALLIKEGGQIKYWQYWDVNIVEDNTKSESDWIDELEHLFHESVKKHLIADVPVGVFLSGGLDSSSIVSAASRFSTKPVMTFSARFQEDKDLDEGKYQHIVASKYNTKHHEFTVSMNDLTTARHLVNNMDEPFSVTSLIPLYIICREAAKHVKVVLSGDGGDELFGGYHRYNYSSAQSLNRKIPQPVWRALSSIAQLIPDKLAYENNLFRRTQKYAYMGSLTDDNFFLNTFNIFPDYAKHKLLSSDIVNGRKSDLPPFYEQLFSQSDLKGVNRLLFFDTKTSLVDEMLTKTDISTSLMSIEGRVPFLDKDFAEAAFKVPLKYKIDNTGGKLILKKVLANMVPPEIVNRKKAGFNLPINHWMTQFPLDEICSHWLLNKSFVERLYKANKNGDCKWGLHLWLVYVLNNWLERNKI